MISKIKIENFKSIGSPGLDIELKPLTILVGPNGSGKSNIMQALALLSTKAGSQFNVIDREKDIPVTRTSELLDLIHKRDPCKWLTLAIRVALDSEEAQRLTLWLKDVNQEKLGIKIPSIKTIGYSFSWQEERTESHQSVFISGQEIVRVAYAYDGKKGSYTNTYESPKRLQGARTSGSTLNLLDLGVFRPPTEIPEAKVLMNLVKEIVRIIASKVKEKVFFISTLRGDVPYSPETRPRPPVWVGMKGENIVQILSLLGQRRHKKKREKVVKWTGRFGLVEVSGTWTGYDKLKSDYADPHLDTALNSALASHGSKQMLSIIVQLFWSEPHDIVMIEEPEISLHPDSQALLPELFAEVINEGKQIVITTHSEFLLLAMSGPVRNGLIRPEDIAIYHVSKDSKGTHAKLLEVTPEGYVKGWVPSFAEIEQKLLKQWLQTMPEEE